jgi:predicted esterase
MKTQNIVGVFSVSAIDSNHLPKSLMEHLKFSTPKTAHVFTHGIINENTQHLWFVAHGYGQLASSIIRKFEHLDPSVHAVVAPEALNRFYWRFPNGETGASWMTRRDRLDEIEDYTNYLMNIYEFFTTKTPPSVKIHFLGFSQGCATLLRWICARKKQTTGQEIRFDRLILWAGVLPDDIDYQQFSDIFKHKTIEFLCGDADEFINADRIQQHLDFAQQHGLTMRFIPFIGKHEILTDVFDKLLITDF